MDLRKLKTLIDLVAESGISELEITEGEDKVRIVKNQSGPIMTHAPAPPTAHAAVAPQPAPAAAAGRARGAERSHRHLADGRHLLSVGAAGRRRRS